MARESEETRRQKTRDVLVPVAREEASRKKTLQQKAAGALAQNASTSHAHDHAERSRQKGHLQPSCFRRSNGGPRLLPGSIPDACESVRGVQNVASSTTQRFAGAPHEHFSQKAKGNQAQGTKTPRIPPRWSAPSLTLREQARSPRRRPRTRLELQNHTDYSTPRLKSFVKKGLEAMGVRKKVGVAVLPHASMTRGVAEVGGNKLFLFLPRPSRLHVAHAAKVLEHEALHLRGTRHEDMSKKEYWSLGKKPGWAKGLKL